MRYGVPQGSVSSPLFSIVYISPIQGILTRHSVDYYKFADKQPIVYPNVLSYRVT